MTGDAQFQARCKLRSPGWTRCVRNSTPLGIFTFWVLLRHLFIRPKLTLAAVHFRFIRTLSLPPRDNFCARIWRQTSTCLPWWYIISHTKAGYYHVCFTNNIFKGLKYSILLQNTQFTVFLDKTNEKVTNTARTKRPSPLLIYHCWTQLSDARHFVLHCMLTFISEWKSDLQLLSKNPTLLKVAVNVQRKASNVWDLVIAAFSINRANQRARYNRGQALVAEVLSESSLYLSQD